MDNGDHHERRARYERYLLGTLDEQERASVRDAVIRDPDAEAELREIELDLLDAAADGTIDPARKSVVEERLAADTRNHAATLVALALAEHRKREDRKRESRRSIWRASVWLPAAAALVMAAGLGWFLLRGNFTLPPGKGDDTPSSTDAATRGPDDALGTAPRPEAGLPPGTDAPQGPPSAIAGPAGSSPGAGAGAATGDRSGTAPAASPNATASLPAQARTVALFLPAGTLRGARPSVLVPPSAETIRLELELEQPAPPFVSVTLRAVREPAATGASPDPSSAPSVLWSAARVPVRNEGGQHIATVTVPARALPTGVVDVHITAQSGAASSSSAPPDSASTPLRAITFLVRRD